MSASTDPSFRFVLAEDAPYVRNLAALWATDPKLAAALEALDGQSCHRTEPSKAGPPTVAVNTDEGRLVYLHSRYQPIEEARRLIEAVNAEACVAFYLQGLGLGYHLELLFDRASDEAIFCVLEPDLLMVRTALETRDLSRLIESRRVLFFWQADKSELFVRLSSRAAMLSMGFEGVAHPASLQLHGAFHRQMQTWIGEFAAYYRTSLNTLVLNGRRTAENISRNLAWYVATPGAKRLKDRYKGFPAVVVSAGPSLRKNKHLLKGLRDRAVLVAVQTTLQPLGDLGIEPQFATALDYHDISTHFYEKLPRTLSTELVAEPKATSRIFSMYPGPLTLLGNDFAESLLREMKLGKPQLPAGATVAHLAYYLAEHLGCDPIIFVGQDLGFSDGLCYSPGTSHEDVWRPELSRFCTIEMKQWEFIVRDRHLLRKIPDYEGRAMYTEERLFTYLQQFERDFARTQTSDHRCHRRGGAEARRYRDAAGGRDRAVLHPAAPAGATGSTGAALGPNRPVHPEPPAANRRSQGDRADQPRHPPASGGNPRPHGRSAACEPRHRPPGQAAGADGAAGSLLRVDSPTNTIDRITAIPARPADRCRESGRRRAPAPAGWPRYRECSRRGRSRPAVPAPHGRGDWSTGGNQGPAGGGGMKHVTAVLSMLHETPERNSATRLFRARPVLETTLQRLGRSQRIETMAVLCWEDQLPDVSPLADEGGAYVLAKGPRVCVPAIESIAAAQRWSDGWRGGLMGTCAFDLGFYGPWIGEICQKLSSDAILLVDAAAGLIDPKLVDVLVGHATAREAVELCFSAAAPGLSAALLRPLLLERLAAAHLHPGKLLQYLPDQPTGDPVHRDGCAPVPTPVARTCHRFKLDSDRQVRRIDQATVSLNGKLATTDAEELVHRLDAVQSPDLLPREVVLELNTARATRPIYWAGRHLDLPARELSLEQARTLFAELGAADDMRLTLAGVGDPLLAPRVLAIVQAARQAGVTSIQVETDLLAMTPDQIDGLIQASIDIVSVHVPATTPATYEAVMGVDGFERVLANIRLLLQRRKDCARGVPLLVPIFTKCRENLGEMEQWYDQWLRVLGSAVINGPTDHAGQIPDTALADMSPAQAPPVCSTRLALEHPGRRHGGLV